MSLSGNFVRNLYLALAHQVDPDRLFVILTAYFDESGTHGGSPSTVVAGAMGTVAQWRRFEKQINALRRKYGFKTFHTKKFKSRSGEFAGWSVEKCVALLDELTPLSGVELMHSFTAAINNEDYQKEFKASGSPSKLRLDTPYGLAFRLCLTSLATTAINKLHTHKKFEQARLNVVVERGHKNAGDALRIFNEETTFYRNHGLNLLGDITFADKSVVPLMVADFLAHMTFEAAGRSEVPEDLKARPGEKTNLTHLRYETGGLAKVRENLIEEFNARRTVSRRFSGGSPP